MNWEEVCKNPDLKDLQYRIELNRTGQIVMSPASNEHSFRQSRIIKILLRQMDHGEVLPECSIDTSDGTKVADVVWFSDEFYQELGLATPFTKAPELCIEVISPSNTDAEMEIKKGLYFEQGALEFWICNEDSSMVFYSPKGEINTSALVPKFPTEI